LLFDRHRKANKKINEVFKIGGWNVEFVPIENYCFQSIWTKISPLDCDPIQTVNFWIRSSFCLNAMRISFNLINYWMLFNLNYFIIIVYSFLFNLNYVQFRCVSIEFMCFSVCVCVMLLNIVNTFQFIFTFLTFTRNDIKL